MEPQWTRSATREGSMYFNLYKSVDDGLWYWSISTDDSNLIAVGGEGYFNKQDAYNRLNQIQKNGRELKVYDESQEE
jgi:uncharacterized protein YegP (UPF0339 family)